MLRLRLSMTRKTGQFELVFFKTSHPLWPVALLCAAGEGPGTSRVVFFVPLERPQLLKSYLPCREIQKNAVDKPVVPVETDPGYVRVSLPYLAIKIRR